jgi:hypothetical protein
MTHSVLWQTVKLEPRLGLGCSKWLFFTSRCKRPGDAQGSTPTGQLRLRLLLLGWMFSFSSLGLGFYALGVYECQEIFGVKGITAKRLLPGDT